jgi:FKBP-type peptidyl-prolyl cis-trans isomerase FkpA
MSFLNRSSAILVAIALLMVSCNNSTNTIPNISDVKVKDTLQHANATFVSTEKERIANYVARHNLAMKATGTGLLYSITLAKQGTMPVPNSRVKVNYSVSLLNGALCYTTAKTGAETFRVDHDDVESGVHEGVKLMHEGEKAKFIIPAHLAHGLLGDLNKIPPRSALVYDLELISVN